VRLQRLFLLLSLLLSLTVLALAAGGAHDAWQHLRQARRGGEAMQQLQALLVAAEMASRERGPANGVMGDDLPGDPAKQERLRGARARTDAAFAAVDGLIADAATDRPALANAAQQARRQLATGREAVDAIARQARAARDPLALRAAVAQMIGVIDALAPASTLLANEAQASFPAAADALQGARLAAALREYAGQLGSQFTAPLTKRQPLSTPELVEIERLRGRVMELRRQLSERTAAAADRPAVQAAMAAVVARYFDTAMPFVNAQLAIGLADGQFAVDTAGFAARYVPDMDAIIGLRDALLHEALADAEQGLRRERLAAAWVAGSGLQALGLLAITLWLLHRRVIRPLGRTTALVVAMADGKLDSEVPKPRYRDEVAELLEAIGVLRQNSRKRLTLEQERQQLVEQLAERNRYLALNNSVFHKLSDGLPLPELLDGLMKDIEAERPGIICTVLLSSPDGSKLCHAAAPSMPAAWIEATREVMVGEGVGSCGTAAWRKQRVVVEDVQTHPFWSEFKDIARAAGLGSCWSQPFMDASGRVLGTFAIYHAQAASPGEAEIRLIESCATLVAHAVERARLADALASQHAMLQEILDNSPVKIGVSVGRRVRFANRRLRENFGVQVGDDASAIFVDPRDSERLLALLGREGVVRQQELRMFNDAHQARDILATFMPIVFEGEQGILGWMEDITEQKAAQQVIAEQQKAMQLLLDRSPVGTAFTTQGVIRYTNPAFEAMFDARVGDLALSIYASPEDRDDVLAIIRRDGQLRLHEMKLRGPGGALRDYLATFVPFVRQGEEGLMGWLFDVTERKATEDAIRKMAHYDKLTGLPNRRLLEDRLHQLVALSAREGRKLALLFIDLDKFKQVNDQHGHAAGDWLLREVARRMSECLRGSDTAARVGGDEFVVLLPDAANVESALLVAEKIRARLEQAFVTAEGVTLDVSSSIGLVMYPDMADNPRDLLRHGDEAMYRAKQGGRNAVEVFSAPAAPASDRPQILRLNWKPDYAWGHAVIDAEHRELFRLANALLARATQPGAEHAGYDRALNELMAYTQAHFAHEEGMLRELGYPQLEQHVALHRALLAQAQGLRRSATADGPPLAELMKFLVNDLVAEHLEREDMKYAYLFAGTAARH
jgi:diguanylate cyclase (GGDEF)-like protein/hemerythrin-like metal-binding protein/PAS domain S-box-containing protein